MLPKLSSESASPLNRRELLQMAAVAGLGVGFHEASAAPGLEIAAFAADVTAPLGHPLMGGGIVPAMEIQDPLEARGIVLKGQGLDRPVVLLSVDWCEIRNDAYAAWRHALAKTVGTAPERILLSATHVHDAPITDLRAQQILEQAACEGRICDPDFHHRAIQRVCDSVSNASNSFRAVSHVGYGKAKVERIASNRRYLDEQGQPRFDRMSATRDAYAREQPEGTVDPWLQMLTFWDGEVPLASLSHYATHPMSHYGRGRVSADFIGMARRQREQELPGVHHIYFSGCSGNIVAGKYNDGADENRSRLAERLATAMRQAWAQTERQPSPGRITFRRVPMRLEPRDTPEFTVEALRDRLRTDPKPFGQCLAALGLSWRECADQGATIDVVALDFGVLKWLLLPAESYVEYQLFAQEVVKSKPVCVAGYGECAPGYIPTDRHFDEGDSNLSDWCWVARGSESRMRAAIRDALLEEDGDS